ncbi:MAG TPA: hypothetical protein VF735_22550 [Pyrinomonadaceae bacterium]|jgi:hypothetical protein
MNSILSGISSYFSRSLILGTFLPVVIFVVFAWLLAVPMLPSDWPFFEPLEALDTQGKVLAISFFTIVLSGIQYNVNSPLIRLYEGYPWQNLWIGRRRKKHFQRQFKILQAQWKGMPRFEFELQQAARQRGTEDTRIKQVLSVGKNAGLRLNTDFPKDEKLVLPTRLGNVIRSFESYADIQYNMEAVTLWPRLVAKLDKEYSGEIDGTKTSFDFMLNCSALSAVLALLVLIVGLIYPTPLTSLQSALLWLVEINVFLAAAFFFYRLSIDRAKAWGHTVKAAFDLYRWDLLKQLGYSRLPQTVAEERALWRNISLRMSYGDYYMTPPAEYSPRTTFVEPTPDFIVLDLELTRGIAAPDEKGELVVKLSVKNRSSYDAEKIVLTDTLPDDFRYKWDSAAVENPSDEGSKVSVAGINPYRFTLGRLEKNKALILTYRGLSTSKEVEAKKKKETDRPTESRLAVDFKWLDTGPADGPEGA